MPKQAHYDDPSFSYEEYWQGREYEHGCEVLAINRLINSKRFESSADIGGGYGRLTPLLAKKSTTTYLVEPSVRLIKLAHAGLKKFPAINFISGTSDNTHLPNYSLDLVTIIRVLHHLPELKPTFTELARITKPNGLLIIEFANSTNFKSRINNWLSGRRIRTLPLEKRSSTNIKKKTIPFVNHHPDQILYELTTHGFTPVSILSVSNFRSSFLKSLIPVKFLLVLEWIAQTFLSRYNFGPSIFVLARKT